MKNRVYIFIAIFLVIFSNFGADYSFSREKFKNQDALSSFELNEIKSMELKIFNYSFENESVSKRLERLELKVFNVVGADSYKNRIKSLKSALNRSNNFGYTIVQPYYPYNNAPIYYNTNPYYRRPLSPNRYNTYKSKINALRNLKSYLNGTMTGYTLPVQNYPYNNNYYSSNDSIFSNGGSSYDYTGNGFSQHINTTQDGGIKIKIID